MGLDFLDVAYRIEKEFGVSLSEADMQDLVHSRDIRVGNLYDLILNKLGLEDNARNSVTLNFAIWQETQSALCKVTQLLPEEIKLQTSMASLFPRKQRRESWAALQSALPYRIRELDYAPAVRMIALFMTGLVAYVELAKVWRFAGAPWFWPFMGILGVWVFTETYVKSLAILAPFRDSLPSGLESVKDLCRDILGANYDQVCRRAQVQFDNRCTIVWHQLAGILEEALGVDADEITFRSRLIQDLDMA